MYCRRVPSLAHADGEQSLLWKAPEPGAIRMRTFGQVPLALWRNPGFVGLSDDARLALLFLWCGPHSTSAGVYVLPDGYAALDLGWDVGRWIKGRNEIEEAGFIARDLDTQTILIRDYFVANRPTNARHLAAIRSQLSAITCSDIKQEAERALEGVISQKNQAYGNVQHLETPHLQRAQAGVR